MSDFLSKMATTLSEWLKSLKQIEVLLKSNKHSNRHYQPGILNLLGGPFSHASVMGLAQVLLKWSHESPNLQYLCAISYVIQLTDCGGRSSEPLKLYLKKKKKKLWYSRPDDVTANYLLLNGCDITPKWANGITVSTESTFFPLMLAVREKWGVQKKPHYKNKTKP